MTLGMTLGMSMTLGMTIGMTLGMTLSMTLSDLDETHFDSQHGFEAVLKSSTNPRENSTVKTNIAKSYSMLPPRNR